jgi:hypothetical protein
MQTLHPSVVEILVAFARSSPENARLAQIDPARFVTLALRAKPLGVTVHPGGAFGVSATASHGVIQSTTWDQRWLQPTQEP